MSTRNGLDYLLKKIDTQAAVTRFSGSGHPRTACTSDNVDVVKELVMSHENQPQTHRTIRHIARETGVHRSSVRRIVKNELKLKCLKKKRAQDFSNANKLTRLDRSRQLLRRYPSYLVNFIWFTDEKLFTVAAPSNSQNDRLYVHADTRNRDVDGERLFRTRPTYSKSVMVLVGISNLGRTDLYFFEPGVKINGQYYRDVPLLQKLLPDIRQQSSNYLYLLQQDSAQAHRARETVTLLNEETP